MKDFEKILNEELEHMATSAEAKSKLELANEIAKELEQAKNRVTELELSLRHTIEEYNIELARCLRKKIPGLDVNLSNGRCSTSYRSTNLSCKPDLDSKTWSFDLNPHGRRFCKKFGTFLNLSDDLNPLADAIAQYFGKYKTLR